MDTQIHTLSAPDFHEVCDQMHSFVTSLEGLSGLFGGQDTSLNPEYLAQVLNTYIIHAKLCQKALQRATDCYYGHLN